jgi:hypothetical protein
LKRLNFLALPNGNCKKFAFLSGAQQGTAFLQAVSEANGRQNRRFRSEAKKRSFRLRLKLLKSKMRAPAYVHPTVRKGVRLNPPELIRQN